VPAGSVIIASHVSSGSSLATELAATGIEVHTVGDAAAVGYIEGAVHSAWAVAAQL
jgi:hypothetical protein